MKKAVIAVEGEILCGCPGSFSDVVFKHGCFTFV